MIIQHIKNNQIRIIEKYLMKKNAVVIMGAGNLSLSSVPKGAGPGQDGCGIQRQRRAE